MKMKKKGMANGGMGKKMKKKGMAKGGMKKGYAAGGVSKPDFLDIDKDGNKKESMKKASQDRKGVMNGGMMKKKGMAKGGKVMTYNIGGMVKSQGKVNTGIRMAKGGAMGGMKKNK